MSTEASRTNRRPSESDPHDGLDITEIESYLSRQAEISQAQHFAERFADRMPWLTASQRQDVIRHYIADRLHLMDHIASCYRHQHHLDALRFRSQKMRLIATLLGVITVTAGTVAMLAEMLAAQH
ncbi:hypothetical protein [Streptomyces sp. RPT161]|uniref:hypothetical protein n=1 Tax=Streptomyces sp. RPT161 TaxID=3015993 RepID=UPI0022B8B166|nr:hypothetical protein [Streptomyces sp. RPT161]